MEQAFEAQEQESYKAEPEPEVKPKEADRYELDDYAGVVETVWFTPEKDRPERKIRLDLRTQALRGADLNLIERRWNKRRADSQELNYLQDKLDKMTPPREIARLREDLAAIRDFDYADADKADEVRDRIEREIESMTAGYEADRAKLIARRDELANLPTLYELLRAEVFAKIIEYHSIDWHGQPLDFHSSDLKHEPPDTFCTALYQFILDKLQRGKATRRNGGSRR